MNPKFFDAHCHIQFDQFSQDQKALIERMQAEGVEGLVVGVDADSSRKAAELAQEHDNVWVAVGLHPNRVETEKYDEHLLRNLMMYPKVVAVGECGLDYYRATQANAEVPTSVFAKQAKGASSAYFRPAEVTDEIQKKQKEIFERQVHLAGQTGRPLIIHSRPSKGTMDAYHDVLEILIEAKDTYPTLTGDIHFFVGGVEEAQAFITLGFMVSFTAVITFARDYDAVIRAVPLTSILSETDSPYVPPTNRTRGSRNDPLAVQDVVAKIAEIRGENPDTVRAALLANAERLFAL